MVTIASLAALLVGGAGTAGCAPSARTAPAADVTTSPTSSVATSVVRTPTVTPDPTPSLPPLVDPRTVPDLPAAYLATARKAGWEIHVVRTVDELTPAEKRSRARAVSRMHADLAGVSLARLTIHGYGRWLGRGKGPDDGGWKLVVKDRLVWVAVARQAPMRVFGPREGATERPDVAYGDQIMFIVPGRSSPQVGRSL